MTVQTGGEKSSEVMMISYGFGLKIFHNAIIIRYIPLFCASFHIRNTSNMNIEERLASVGRNIQEKAVHDVLTQLYVRDVRHGK